MSDLNPILGSVSRSSPTTSTGLHCNIYAPANLSDGGIFLQTFQTCNFYMKKNKQTKAAECHVHAQLRVCSYSDSPACSGLASPPLF